VDLNEDVGGLLVHADLLGETQPPIGAEGVESAPVAVIVEGLRPVAVRIDPAEVALAMGEQGALRAARPVQQRQRRRDHRRGPLAEHQRPGRRG